MIGVLVLLSCWRLPAQATAAPDLCAAKSSTVDVVIVGAGMAGLTAARQLQPTGLSYVLLEAQDRIGGRGVVVSKGLDTPIDLGGAWIHGVETNPLTPYVLASGRTMIPTDVSGVHHLYLDGRFARPRELEAFACILESYEENLAESAHPDDPRSTPQQLVDYVDPSAAIEHLPTRERCADELAQLTTSDATFEQLLALAALNVGPLESAVELKNNATKDAADFSAGDDALIEGGYGAFVERYGEPVRDRACVSSTVKKVEYGKSGVVVSTEDGRVYKGQKVLVTVSTGVLAKGVIAFSPALPADKLKAIENLPMGVLNKVILQFDAEKMQWPVDVGVPMNNRWVLYGGKPEDPNDDLAFVFRPADTGVVIAFVGGDRAIAWEKADNKPFVDATFHALDDMCKCDARAALVGEPITTRWSNSPISYGAYSAAKPGGIDWRAVLAEPVDSRLYFAGEACYNAEYNGSYAAAYSSGIVAAGRIVEDFCATGGTKLDRDWCLGR